MVIGLGLLGSSACDATDDGAEFRAAVEDAAVDYGAQEQTADDCAEGLGGCEGEACRETLDECLPPRPDRPEDGGDTEGAGDDRPPPPDEPRRHPFGVCVEELRGCLGSGGEPRACIADLRECIHEIVDGHFRDECRHHVRRCLAADVPERVCRRLAARCDGGLPRPDDDRPDDEPPAREDGDGGDERDSE